MTSRESLMLAMLGRAIEERGANAEVYAADPNDVRACKALMKRGIVTMRDSGGRIGRLKEYYYRLNPSFKQHLASRIADR